MIDGPPTEVASIHFNPRALHLVALSRQTDEQLWASMASASSPAVRGRIWEVIVQRRGVPRAVVDHIADAAATLPCDDPSQPTPAPNESGDARLGFSARIAGLDFVSMPHSQTLNQR